MSKTITKQSAVGVAKGSYDQVAFNLSIEGRAATGPQAKNKASEIINRDLKFALDKLAKVGIIFEEKDTQSGFSVVQHFTYDKNERKPSGYLATYALRLPTTQVDRASEIHDVLTSIEGANVSSPTFILKSGKRRELQKLAIKEAFRIASERFQEECQIVGLNPNDFEIEKWNTQYNDYYETISIFANGPCGPTGIQGCTGDSYDPDIEVQSGLASIQVTLNIAMRRKFAD